MGEILIDFMGMPKGTALVETEQFQRKAGGAPANVAVGVQRLGVQSAFIGMVGDDAFGAHLRSVLEQDSVDTRSLAVSKSQPTTLAFVAIDQEGVPSFSFYRHPGADLSITPDDIDKSVFEEAQIFHFGSLSLCASPAYDTTLAAIELARARNMFITYDPNYRPALWNSEETARKAMLEPIQYVDLLKVSSDELALLSGVSDIEEGCAEISAHGPKIIIVTRGGEGMLGWNRGQLQAVPPARVEVVDTTGCGDSSMAGVIARLVRAHDGMQSGMELDQTILVEALRYANRAAGMTATRLGAIPALPTAEEVEQISLDE
jgi:fructokinase